MSEHKQPGILYLERNTLHFFNGSLANVLSLQFPPEVMRDLDIVDRVKLEDLVKTFVQTNKIPPTNANLVLSQSVLFIKDFVNAPVPVPQAPVAGAPIAPPQPVPVKIDPLIEGQKYLESVPFEDVGSKSEPLPNGIRIIAANKDTYMGLKTALEKVSISLDAVTPVLSFEKFLNMTGGFTTEIARTMLQRSDIAKQNSLLIQKPSFFTLTPENDKNSKDKKGPNKKLFLMIGVFVVLIIVMVLMFLRMQAQNSAESQRLQANQAAQSLSPNTSNVAISPSVTPEETVASASANLTIQVLSNTSNTALASDLKDSLLAADFSKVTADTTQTTVPQKTVIIVQESVTTVMREKILEIVKEVSPLATIVESSEADADADVVITLGSKPQ